MKNKSKKSDVLIHQTSSNFMLVRPVTNKGRDWMEEHVNFEDAQLFGNAVVVEQEFIEAIAQGMTRDGLNVSTGVEFN